LKSAQKKLRARHRGKHEGRARYAESVLRDLRKFADDDLPNYTDCLTAAFANTEPVFVRERYGEFFWHCATSVPGWLGAVVLANAAAESDGSAKLLRLWQGTADTHVGRKVFAHAEDEAGHSRLFVELAGAAFPSIGSREIIRALASGLTKVDGRMLTKSSIPLDHVLVVDHLVQMNIGEIRTRAHMHLIGPAVLSAAPESKQAWVGRTLDRLGGDEVRHVGYTARLMEGWCRDGLKSRIRDLYSTRLREFNDITVSQTEAAVRTYGMGQYPDLLQI